MPKSHSKLKEFQKLLAIKTIRTVHATSAITNYIRDNIIYVDNKEVINTNEIRLKGQHNYEDILLALLIVKQFSFDTDIIKDFLRIILLTCHHNDNLEDYFGCFSGCWKKT